MKILLYNGKVLTQDHRNPIADTVLIDGNTIAFVGRKNDLSDALFDDVLKIDLKKKVLLPGFIDCHTHFVNYAFSKKSIDLTGSKSIQDLKTRLENFRNNHPEKKEWIHGFGWDNNLWDDPTFFNIEFIDNIFPDIPVSLSSKDLHSFLCNSKSSTKNEYK